MKSVCWLLLGMAIVVTPWATRNIQLLHRFAPLGTQGSVQMAAAYSDEIWESRGQWVNPDALNRFAPVIDSRLTPLEQELAKADHGIQLARSWISAHPFKAIALFPIKVWQEHRPRGLLQMVIFVAMCIGIVVMRKQFLGQLLFAILLVNASAIGVTWSVEGRFLVPVLMPIHLLATAGIMKILQSLFPSRIVVVWE